LIGDLRGKGKKKTTLPHYGRDNPLNLVAEYKETTLVLVSL